MAAEKNLEEKFKSEMKKMGWRALKLSCPGYDGMPDRIVLKDNGQVFFAELKAPGEKLRALQAVRRRELQEAGFRVYVVDSEDMIRTVWMTEGNHGISAA